MNNFDRNFNKIMGEIKLHPAHDKFKKIQRCKNEFFKFRDDHLISEMNISTYPIPKKLLSELVRLCYSNDWKYANEFVFNYLIKLVKESENISQCKFDIDKLKEYRNHCLLFICLPYNLSIWKDHLKKFFASDDIIEKLFEDFNGENGAAGTYSNGQIIIINSDMISTLKDGEEMIEHELVHMFEDIDGAENVMSQSMQMILTSPNEVKTYTINLINSLYALYDHKQTMFTDQLDSKKERKKFLDNIFEDAEISSDIDVFYEKYRKYENSKLLYQNLWFLWNMCRWQPEEFDKFKNRIYEDFIQ